MDNPSNLDGFDGLPLDLWISQLQSQHENPTSAFHNSVSQPLRDYSSLTNRTMAGAFPLEDTFTSTAQSSHMSHPSLHSQYNLSLPSQSDHQAPSHERSAWSQLMSLDQSMGPYGTHEPARLMQTRYSPLEDLVEKTREDNSMKTHAMSTYPNINLIRSPFSSVLGSSMAEGHSTYFQHPSFHSSQEKLSQPLVHLMNLSKTTSSQEKTSLPLSVVTDLTLESSGEYSPVSPPTTVPDKMILSRSSMNPGRVSDLLPRDNEDILSEPTDIFNYFNKMNSCPTDLSVHAIQDNKVPPHLLHSSSNYTHLPSPSDTPLDMTKTEKTEPIIPKLIVPVTFQSSNQSVTSNAIVNEKLPLLQTLLNKGKKSADTYNAAEDDNSHPLKLTMRPQIKMVKPLKSTPKKSNFYGRDASLFSFPSQDNDASCSGLVDDISKSMDNKSDIIKHETDGVVGKSNNERCDISLTDTWDNTNQNTSKMELTLNDNSIISQGDASIFSPENSFTSDFNSSLAQSIDSFIEESTRKTVQSANVIDNEKMNDNNLTCADMETKEFETNNSFTLPDGNNESFNDYHEDNFPCMLTIEEKPKAVRGKKRRGGASQGKPRKQPARKRGCAQNVKTAFKLEDEIFFNADEALVREEIEPIVSPVAPKKKRAPPRSRVAAPEVTPRRSSSRKSKDNAMRLIELQAEPNYSGFRQPNDEQVVEIKSLRSFKRTANTSSLDANDDISEKDSIEDKSDAEYQIDEEELMEEEDIMDADLIKKTKDKKIGGLKISIKLSGNSSAEIVSGISDTPVKKKRKVVKKKVNKSKNKTKIINDNTLNLTDEVEKKETGQESNTNNEELSTGSREPSDKQGIVSHDSAEIQKSLMDKYFSSANSASFAKQTQKTSKLKTRKNKNAASKAKSKLLKEAIKINEDLGIKPNPVIKNKTNKEENVLDKEDVDATPKFVCGYCPQRYHSKQDLMSHMEDHMTEMESKTNATTLEEKKKPNELPNSTSANRDPRANKLSVKTSAQNSAKQASVEKKTNLIAEISKNLVSKEEIAKTTKFKCGECGEAFASKPSLLDHVRIHTADKPFECDICHKCFTERNLLSAHRKTHVPEKLLRCHMCSKAFVDKADLNYHMQSHPKRSVTNVLGKPGLAQKMTIKKSLQESLDNVAALPPKKPTSFASALIGEVEASDKDSSSSLMLHLKRSTETSVPGPKVPSSNTLGKPISSDTKAPAAVKSDSVQKVKTSDAKTKMPDVSTKVNDLEKTPVTKTDSLIPLDNAPIEKPPEKMVPGQCVCKECPECVTRFLLSFE